jgi:hypothetical protein
VKYQGSSCSARLERATGSAAAERDLENRTWNQYAVEGIFRFLPREQVYVGARYNTVERPARGRRPADVSIDRFQVGAGWFIYAEPPH